MDGNQSKDCRTIDQYISAQPATIRPLMEKIRQTIKKACPEAEENISYQMPVFRYKGILMYFAPFKNHYSIFTSPNYLLAFKEELKAYTTTKSSVHFLYNKPVPVSLITKIVKYAAKQNAQKVHNKEKTKKKVGQLNTIKKESGFVTNLKRVLK